MHRKLSDLTISYWQTNMLLLLPLTLKHNPLKVIIHTRLLCPSLSLQILHTSMRKKTPWFVFVVAYMNLTFLHYSLVGYPPRVSFFPAFSCCFSVTKSCLTLCNPMDCSTPVFPVLHHLLEVAQTHVHWVTDAIQPSHPLSTPSPPALNLSQHQDLF